MPTLTTHTLSLYTYDGSENGHNFLVAHLSFARACDFPPPFKMHFSPWKWVKDFELTLFIFKLIALRLIEMWDYYQCFICNSSWLKIHTFCMCEVVRCSFRRNIFAECRKCSGEWQLHCWQLCRGFAFLWWNVTFSNYIHWKRVHTVKRHAYVTFAHSFERKTARAKCMSGWIKGWKLCHNALLRYENAHIFFLCPIVQWFLHERAHSQRWEQVSQRSFVARCVPGIMLSSHFTMSLSNHLSRTAIKSRTLINF